jgi:acetyl-CoA C-acetyltransferase
VIDAHSPVIVGVGQTSQRLDDLSDAREPIDLLADAVRASDADTGATRSLVRAADTFAVVDMLSWKYADPGALLARRLGIGTAVTSVTTTVGGNSPELLVHELSPAIAKGDTRIAVIGGSECIYSRWRARREPKAWLEWTKTEDAPCHHVIGDARPGTNDYEMAHLAAAPTQIYPLFETALRGRAGRDVTAHQRHVSELWAHFAAVAADNPHAWSRIAYSPEEIRTADADNRVVTFPYLKRMCANIDTDQAAAVILCSYEAARDAGVAQDRMVFPLAGADAYDHFWFSERDSLATSPAIRAAGDAALDAAGCGIDDVARFDLYSCFPAAVEMAMEALRLRGPQAGDSRPLTVTGGLGFAGGPGNNYSTHSIAMMVDACRRDPGSVGMVTALGWYVTKHSIGLYSTTPPGARFARVDPAVTQSTVDATPRRGVTGPYSGPATVEATSVVFDRDGMPEVAIVSTLTPDGRRALANSHDADILGSMTEEAWEGRAVQLDTDGTTSTVAP